MDEFLHEELNEFDIIRSIYGEEESNSATHTVLFMADDSKRTGVFTVAPHVSESGLKIISSNGSSKQAIINYLPPVRVEFKLPPDYPCEAPPIYQIFCSWLTPTQMLTVWEKLGQLWQSSEGEPILWESIVFLRDELLDYLDIHDNLDLSNLDDLIRTKFEKYNKDNDNHHDIELARTSNVVPQQRYLKSDDKSDSSNYSRLASCDDIATYLQKQSDSCEKVAENTNSHCKIGSASNLTRQASANSDHSIRHNSTYRLTLPPGGDLMKYLQTYNYQHTIFMCNICMEERIGARCWRLRECHHIFCRDCLSRFYETLIEDGQSADLKCPNPECAQTASPDDVIELVRRNLYTKYDEQLRQIALSKRRDTDICPRLFCQSVVVLEKDSQMGLCPSCELAFCVFCKKTYHGLNACRMNSDEKHALYDRFVNGTDDERRQLELRHGARFMKRLKDDVEADMWISNNSKPCPSCRTRIEKIEGCNKMICSKCSTQFCWLCLEDLSRLSNPYVHFNTRGAACYEKLFMGVEDQFDDDDDEDYYMGAFLQII